MSMKEKILEKLSKLREATADCDKLNLVLLCIEAVRNTEDEKPVGKWVHNRDGVPVCSCCGNTAPQRLFLDLFGNGGKPISADEALSIHPMSKRRYIIKYEFTPYCPHCSTEMSAKGGLPKSAEFCG